MKQSLEMALKKLSLSGFTSTLDVRLQEAKANRLNHAEFLELALQDELVVRKERRIARRTKAAAFREQKSLRDFDWIFNSSIRKKESRMVLAKEPRPVLDPTDEIGWQMACGPEGGRRTM